jgi:hypothetical protein
MNYPIGRSLPIRCKTFQLAFAVPPNLVMADNGPTVPLDVPTMDFETSEEEPSNVWARLIPLATNGRSFPVIDLISDSHTFGRAATCDTKFTELGISGKHCRIYKETLTSAKTSTDIVKIEDTRCVWPLALPVGWTCVY